MSFSTPIRFLLFIFLLCVQPCVAQQHKVVRPDTTRSANIEHVKNEEDDEFNLFLAIFGMIAVSVMAGVALATVFVVGGALVCVGALIAVGVFSISVGAAIYRKSYLAGIKAGLFMLSAILGTACGTVLGYFAKKIFQLDVSNINAVLAGALSGMVGGCIGAACLIWVTRKLFKQFAHGVPPFR